MIELLVYNSVNLFHLLTGWHLSLMPNKNMNTDEKILEGGFYQKEFTCPSKLILHKQSHSGENNSNAPSVQKHLLN